MVTKYTKISEGREIKIENGYLYVRQTNMQHGMLEQGGYADRVYRMSYNGALEDAQAENDIGISDVDRCIESGEVVRKGRLIQ